MTHSPPALLPQGFEDLLPPEAGAQANAITKAMDVFTRFGYARVKPPLAEFEDTLLAPGPGAALSAQTFRLMDPASRRMLALRADITPQIARIAATRLGDAPRPLRLCYANDALRVTGAGGPRQITQLGCERIGDAHHNASVVEIMLLCLLTLRALGLLDITLDITLPGHIPPQPLEVEEALRQRDRDRIAHLAPDLLPLLDSCGPLANFAELAPLHGEIQEALEAYTLSDITFTVDPIETKGFEYHEGIAFALFARGAARELGRGGRYRLPNGEMAVGMTLYLEQVMRVAPPAPSACTTHTYASWTAVRAAQDAGKVATHD